MTKNKTVMLISCDKTINQFIKKINDNIDTLQCDFEKTQTILKNIIEKNLLPDLSDDIKTEIQKTIDRIDTINKSNNSLSKPYKINKQYGRNK